MTMTNVELARRIKFILRRAFPTTTFNVNSRWYGCGEELDREVVITWSDRNGASIERIEQAIVAAGYGDARIRFRPRIPILWSERL